MANKALYYMNRDGFRYYWSEDDPVLSLPYRKYILTSDILKKSSLFRRKLVLPQVRLSENDKAAQLKLDGELTVTGDKGYSMVRATHGVNRGKFYYEVTVNNMRNDNKGSSSELNAARVGWGQKYANLQAPLGYDQYGYSYRSRFGTKFHKAHGKTYDQNGGYGEGDTIGCMIELPFGNKHDHTELRHLPPSVKNTTLICNFKKKDSYDKPRMLEERETIPENMKPLPGSRISFYKNGRYLGTAFEDIYEGFYYPSISLYKDCKVTVNFGPEFLYPPPHKDNSPGLIKSESTSKLRWRPASDMVQIEIIDNLMSDMLYVLDEELNDKGNQIEKECLKAVAS